MKSLIQDVLELIQRDVEWFDGFDENSFGWKFLKRCSSYPMGGFYI